MQSKETQRLKLLTQTCHYSGHFLDIPAGGCRFYVMEGKALLVAVLLEMMPILCETVKNEISETLFTSSKSAVTPRELTGGPAASLNPPRNRIRCATSCHQDEACLGFQIYTTDNSSGCRLRRNIADFNLEQNSENYFLHAGSGIYREKIY